jgi:hypothetical protein
VRELRECAPRQLIEKCLQGQFTFDGSNCGDLLEQSLGAILPHAKGYLAAYLPFSLGITLSQFSN